MMDIITIVRGIIANNGEMKEDGQRRRETCSCRLGTDRVFGRQYFVFSLFFCPYLMPRNSG